MSIDPIRVGVIGAGRNTRDKHIPGLRAQDNVEISGVCNRSRESSQRAADELSIPKIYEQWQDLIADPELDAVVIGTWPYLHADTAIAALDAGKHVMCEARMAMNADEAHAMWAAARANPRQVAQIVPSPMTLRVDRMIQKLLTEGYLGDLLVVDVQAGGDFLDLYAPIHWRQDTDLSGMNIMSMGIWYEAIMRWAGTAKTVMASGQTYVKMRKASEDRLKAVRVPEHIDIIGEMVCGAQLHIQISAVMGLAGAPRATLYGTHGTLQFTQNKLLGGQKEDKALNEIEIPAQLQGGWRVEEEFINAIRGRETITHTSFEDGVKYMEFTEAVTRSIQEGRAVALPL
ncbi:MAG: Gfo/Idh/MocA family oxidoreductase [Caldilineaceae bacterium]|nr:Gfo/Idh/MocA family oxidoreductase [Caldilineaceae bacterium]